jgi:hypothetical protein
VAKYGSVWGGWRSGVITGSHGVGPWKFICRGSRILGGMSSLIQVRALRSAFGITSCVGIELLKRHFQACSSLPDLKRHPLRIMWSVLMAQFNGISSFLD